MATTATIVIEVQDAQATAAMQRVNAQAAQLGQNFQPVPRLSEQAFNSISGGALRARETSALITEEFGVKIPRALRGVIAQSALLGPAFNAAFSGLAILAFAQIAKMALEQLTGFGEALKEIEKQNTALMASVAASNKILLGPQNLAQVTKQLEGAEKRASELNAALGLTGDIFGDSVKTGLAKKFSVGGGLMVEELDKLKTSINTLNEQRATLLMEKPDLTAAKEAIEILKLENATRLAGLEGMAKINEAERGETEVVRQEIQKKIIHVAVGQAEINKIRAVAVAQRDNLSREEAIQETKAYLQSKLDGATGEEKINQELNLKLLEIDQQELKDGIKLDGLRVAAKMEAADKIAAFQQQLADHQRRLEDETIMAERAAAISSAPPWERANATIVANYQERMAKIKEALDTVKPEFRAQQEVAAARQSAAAWTDAFSAMRDKLASDMQSLFDDITSGNIGQRFKKLFEQMVFQMVATWILGMQQMRNASQQQMGGGGGILGAIFGSLGLGGIFGGGGGGGQGGISSIPGVITNFGGSGGGFLGLGGGNGDFGGETSGGSGGSGGGGILGSLFGSLGLSSGQGAGTPGLTLPSGAGPGGGGLLGKIFGSSAPGAGLALAMLGGGLLASSFGKGGVLAGLGGAVGGALIGAMFGPVGLAIGALVGFFAGFFQHSTKKARLAIEANIKAQSQKIEDSYNSFQMDFPTSHDQLEQLRQQGVDALKQAGVKDISRSRVGHVDQWVDKAEKEIAATQAERVRRGAIAFGPAEFRVGGLVGPSLGGPVPSWFAGSAMHFAGGGAVPAFLHEGEYVMRPEAVSRIGPGNLSRMNAGSGSGGDTHVHVHTMDSQSFAEWLRGGGLKEILRETRRAQNEGWA